LIYIEREIMEPRLNIKIADLFDGPSPVDADFIPQGQQMDNDFIDENSNDAARNWQTEMDWRKDWAQEIDRDNASGQAHGRDDTNPAQQTAPYGELVQAKKQARGFNTKQSFKNATLGVLAKLKGDTLTGSRVYAKTASTKISGTVIAVGDTEFAVIWDDRTASVERKGDYELVVKTARDSWCSGPGCKTPACDGKKKPEAE